jgi:hypothetical protein
VLEVVFSPMVGPNYLTDILCPSKKVCPLDGFKMIFAIFWGSATGGVHFEADGCTFFGGGGVHFEADNYSISFLL